jgi:hypothetical protein
MTQALTKLRQRRAVEFCAPVSITMTNYWSDPLGDGFKFGRSF